MDSISKSSEKNTKEIEAEGKYSKWKYARLRIGFIFKVLNISHIISDPFHPPKVSPSTPLDTPVESSENTSRYSSSIYSLEAKLKPN